MVLYRRNFLPGGTYFFTVTLSDRRSSLPVENIDALVQWKYLDNVLAVELKDLFKVRCNYSHSGPINNLQEDALKSVRAAYAPSKGVVWFSSSPLHTHRRD